MKTNTLVIQPRNPPTSTPLVVPDSTASDGLAAQLQELADRLTVERDCELELSTTKLDTRTAMATWYMGKLSEIEAKRALIKEQAAVMISQLDTLESALAWKWGAEFKRCIEAMLQSQGGKKKSIDLLTGRAGFRTKQASIQIVDGAAAIAWCREHCPTALSDHLARTTPIKEYIEKNVDRQTGALPDVPGIVYKPAQDQFYPSSNRAELEYSRVAIT